MRIRTSLRREKARFYERRLAALRDAGLDLRSGWAHILSQSRADVGALEADLARSAGAREDHARRLRARRAAADARTDELIADLAAAKLRVCELSLDLDGLRLRERGLRPRRRATTPPPRAKPPAFGVPGSPAPPEEEVKEEARPRLATALDEGWFS